MSLLGFDHIHEPRLDRWGTPFGTPGAWGAAVVGWRAGSQAGTLMAVPILCASVLVRGPSGMVRAFAAGGATAAMVAVLCACAGLMIALERKAGGAVIDDGLTFAAAMRLGGRLGVLMGALVGAGVALRRGLDRFRPAMAEGIVDTAPPRR